MGGDERPVDLAVIGGGITGAAVARDASLRRMHLGISKNRGREATPAVERLLARLS